MKIDDSTGFSLIETIVALGLLAGAITGLISLFTLSARANLAARHASVATMLASAKLEQLARVVPLTSSPANALDVNVTGFCELLNEHGATIGACATASDRAPYVRRWSVEPLSGLASSTVLRVLVSWSADPAANTWAGLHADEVRLVTLRVEGWR
jgi:type II secretory pathway pseudopilin PulG